MTRRRASASGWIVALSIVLISDRLAATNVSGTISASTTWTTANSPYIVTGGVYVEGASSPVLTIQAGVVVKFNAGMGLFIGNGAAGGLLVNGTSTSGVTFTSNAATPAAGDWVGVEFLTHAVGSTMTYATVSYAGAWSSVGGITVNGSSPTIQNTTVQSCSQWGVVIQGAASPTISSSAIKTNSPGGLTISSPATPSLQTVSFTSNTGYAMSQDAKVTLGTVSGVTATSNGTNGVELRGTVDATTTWKNVGIPYVSPNGTYVEGASAPQLTINSGVVVKMNPGVGLFVGVNAAAKLMANGTAAQPITFSVNSAATTPGQWPGVSFYPNTVAGSKVSFATVSYAGSWSGQGAVYVKGCAPAFDNLTLQTNSVAGMTLSNLTATTTPTIVNSTFANNSAGIINSSPSFPIIASLNYWSAASGPSGSGGGSGQSISTGVVFEPWLIAAPTTSNYIKTSTEKNRTFNPSLSINTTITSQTVSTGTWTTSILNSGGSTVRTFTSSGTSSTTVWDGKDGSGVAQPNGSYFYQLAMSGVTTAKGTTIIDNTKQLTLSGLAVSNAFFSPNADGVQDTTTVSGTFSFDDVAWTLNVKNPGGTTVRTATGNGPSFSYSWDGKNTGGTLQADALYTLSLTGTDGTASVPGSASTTLDTTLPVATITAPTNNQVLSNVYSSGATNVTVTGTASDLNVSSWILDYGSGTWTQLATGTASVTSSTLGTWVTLPVTNAQYTLRLQVWDKAGNYKTTSILNTVGNFKVAENVLEFNGSAGGSVTYTSTVPGLTPSLRETLVVKNAGGQTVRTLLNNVAVSAGNRTDPWDGKNGSAVLQPDGPYFYVATVTDGTHSLTWDLSTQYLNDFNQSVIITPTMAASDPFANQPMVLTRSFSQAANVSINFVPSLGVPAGCVAPGFCWVNKRYEESGTKTYYWAGVDSTGRYRSEETFGAILADRSAFAANAVVLFGTKPAVTAVSVTPGNFMPTLGTMTVSFTLATYQNQTASVTVSFLNQTSLSVLRSISLPNQAPGARTTTWDGKADNGVPVAPGNYLVSVTATDSLGNQAIGQIMAVVQY